MSDTKLSATHTPGPLSISKHATPDYAPQYGIYADADPSRDFATVTGDHALADATLYAAAPDLLAACQALIRDIQRYGTADLDVNDYEALKPIEAAIAKATNP